MHEYKNEQMKREFVDYLEHAKGFSSQTRAAFVGAIAQWQQFSGNEDFASFNKSKAIEFCTWLKTRGAKSKTGRLTPTTQFHYLRHTQAFFKWLSGQPGYRKIQKDDAEFLRLPIGETRKVAIAGSLKRKPTLEDARKIIEHITGKTEVDRRDRALISFTLITGGRISAITSLKMKNFDKTQKIVDQNPRDGVHTKNAKRIRCTFFNIGWDAPERHFMEWYEYLERKGFGPDDPIFPATVNDFSSADHGKRRVQRAAWKKSDKARKMFENRCLEAGLLRFNPHSFRDLIVSMASEIPLTESDKRAISQNLGHENVVTTFGAYGCGKMTDDAAIAAIKQLDLSHVNKTGPQLLTNDERVVLERILNRQSKHL